VLKLSLRSLLMHKLRLFLTVAAVTVGVAFVSGTFVLSDTMSKAFDELYAGLTGHRRRGRAKASYRHHHPGPGPAADDDVVRRVADVGCGRRRGSVTGFALS
jgi:putative ABC transport system permease protein